MRPVVVVGLGYGMEGKGSVIDRIARLSTVSLVVRFNGGPNASSNVMLGSGTQHSFSQLGPGIFRGVHTFLSRFTMVDPLALHQEAAKLREHVYKPMDTVTIDEGALLITPYHRALSIWREESRGRRRHGSTGLGIGPAAEFAQVEPLSAPMVGDLLRLDVLEERLEALRVWIFNQAPDLYLDSIMSLLSVYDEIAPKLHIESANTNFLLPYAERGRILFEGAQGVLLDEHVGFHPYTTWSTTTPDNARTLCLEAGLEPPSVIGVSRAYMIRHGPGPLVSYDPELVLPELNNGANPFQGGLRRGHFDAVALRYAIEACGGVDHLYLTHADALTRESRLRMCTEYRLGSMPYQLTRYPSEDLMARTAQTKALMGCAGVLTKKVPTLDSIAAELELPLIGVSSGPLRGDGNFHLSKLDAASTSNTFTKGVWSTL